MNYQDELETKYCIRQKKKQKEEFFEFVHSFCKSKGYEVKYDNGKFSKNIVLGDIEKAKILLTAHYDTPITSAVPLFSLPTWYGNILKYILTFILGVVKLGFITAVYLATYTFLFNLFPGMITNIVFFVGLILLAKLLFFSPNKNNFNDNTSGISVLLGIIEQMPKETIENVAIVFFDNEEKGLFGSRFLNKKYNFGNSKLVINFDCVGDGDHFMLYKRKNTDIDVLTEIMTKYCKIHNKYFFIKTNYFGGIYGSDQNKFRNSIGIAAYKKVKNIYYFGRIHTKRDIYKSESNINCLVEAILKYIKVI